MINHVKSYRVALGITQQELGDLLNVSRQTIFSIKISKIFTKSVEEVFVLEGND